MCHAERSNSRLHELTCCSPATMLRAVTPTPTAPRTTADRITVAGRMAISFVALGAAFGLLWLALPLARAAMLPPAPPGGWVLGPPVAFRFGASAVLTAFTLPLVLRPLGRRWRERDLAARGAPLDPLASAPRLRAKSLIQGALLLIVYLVSGAFYFASYTEVLADRFVDHSLFGTRGYDYHRVSALELQAPAGDQPERYALRFDDDGWAYFSTDQEGTTAEEIAEVAAHIAAHTGLPWLRTTRP